MSEELRAALEKAAHRFDHCAQMIDRGFSVSGTLRQEHVIKAKHYALEAQIAANSVVAQATATTPSPEGLQEPALREALQAAYEAGAMDVHQYWQNNPGEAPRGDPEFEEAAKDCASDLLASLPTPPVPHDHGLRDAFEAGFSAGVDYLGVPSGDNMSEAWAKYSTLPQQAATDEGEGLEQAKSEGMDEAATFCIETLAKALGVDDYEQADGSETWDGDVAGTIYNVLKAGRVYDDEDGRVARLDDVSTPTSQPPAAETRLRAIEQAACRVLDAIDTCRNSHTEEHQVTAGAELDEATENMRASLTQPEPTAQHGSEEVEAWICDGLPDAMIEAGCGAWDKARIEMQDREASDQPEAYTDWDDGMIVAAIYKAMAPFAALSAQQGGGEEGNDYPACPVCGAPAGMDCRTVQGRIPPHPERVSAQQAAGEAVAWVSDQTIQCLTEGYGVTHIIMPTKTAVLRNALYAAPQPEAPAEVQQGVASYRHKKRGTIYEVVGEATLQCAANPALDEQPLVIYRGEDGMLWARGVTEFHDGRFEALATPQQGQEVAQPEAWRGIESGERLARATYALMEFDIHRYLIANVRHDGAEKALRHRELTGAFLRVYAPKWARRDRELYTSIHDATQVLTNHLDEIGLGDDCHYDDAVPKAFHDRFIELALAALPAAPLTDGGKA